MLKKQGSPRYTDIDEGESVQTNINSQPRKLSSPTKSSKRNAEIVLKLTAKAWWPFDRVDGRLLQKLHKQSVKPNEEEAPI